MLKEDGLVKLLEKKLSKNYLISNNILIQLNQDNNKN